MGTTALIGVTALAALGGVLYNPVKETIYTTVGYGREVQPLSDFPYTCRKMAHPQLQACEDIAIDEIGRKAYLACSTPQNRKMWQPAVDRRTNSGREKLDHFTVLDLDNPGPDGDFGAQVLKTQDYGGALGDGVLDLHGFDIEAIGGNKLRFWVVNHRPPVDPATGVELNAMFYGCNSTVEVFELERGSDTLEWKYTYADPLIKTPNRVAATGENGFVVTNDKSDKVGWRRELDLFIGGGDLVHCEYGTCRLGSDSTLPFPNGIAKSASDGLYYVPSTSDGSIRVFTLMPQGTLRQIDKISVGYPMDNLHVDKNGDIWAAAFPKLLDAIPGFDDPLNARVAAAAIRVRKRQGEGGQGGQDGQSGYVVEKIIEDRDGEVLPMTTSVAHDVLTGRVFFGSVFAPWTAVCDPVGKRVEV